MKPSCFYGFGPSEWKDVSTGFRARVLSGRAGSRQRWLSNTESTSKAVIRTLSAQDDDWYMVQGSSTRLERQPNWTTPQLPVLCGNFVFSLAVIEDVRTNRSYICRSPGKGQPPIFTKGEKLLMCLLSKLVCFKLRLEHLDALLFVGNMPRLHSCSCGQQFLGPTSKQSSGRRWHRITAHASFCDLET